MIFLFFQTWMYVIAPMFLYLCERVLRFIRYMQTVRYRMVCLTRDSSQPSASSPSGYITLTLISLLADCDAAFQGAGAADGKERIQDGRGSVCLP